MLVGKTALLNGDTVIVGTAGLHMESITAGHIGMFPMSWPVTTMRLAETPGEEKRKLVNAGEISRRTLSMGKQ